MKTNIKNKKFIKIVAILFAWSFISAPVRASEITADKVLEYVNEARVEASVVDLVANEKLMSVAQDKLNDIIENNYFAHTSPDGKTPWFWFGKNGYDYQYAGENLAINFLTAESQHKAWMESATHRKNILNPKFREIGIAIGAGEIDGQTSIITVQEFGTRVGAAELNAGKNFSSSKNTNLIKEEGQIIPQVLSVKKISSSAPELNNKIPERNFNAIDYSTAIALGIYLLTLALIPLVFLSVAYEKIILIHNAKKLEEEIPAAV